MVHDQPIPERAGDMDTVSLGTMLMAVCLTAPPSDLARFPHDLAYVKSQRELTEKDYKYWSEVSCVSIHYAAGGIEEVRCASPRLCCSLQKSREVEIALGSRRAWIAWEWLEHCLKDPTESNLDHLRFSLTPEEWAAGQMPVVWGHTKE